MLNIEISSFSYKGGFPVCETVHGGGFVFDCRCLPNPGREEQYKLSTGQDDDVIAFLKGNEEVELFLKNVTALIQQAVDKYISRGFENLSIAFGCTGGQHRSIYCAEYIARMLRGNPDVNISLSHRELPGILKLREAK